MRHFPLVCKKEHLLCVVEFGAAYVIHLPMNCLYDNLHNCLLTVFIAHIVSYLTSFAVGPSHSLDIQGIITYLCMYALFWLYGYLPLFPPPLLPLLFLSSSSPLPLFSLSFSSSPLPLVTNDILLLNFYADWCRFSQQLKPIFEKAADAMAAVDTAVSHVTVMWLLCDSVSVYPAAPPPRGLNLFVWMENNEWWCNMLLIT